MNVFAGIGRITDVKPNGKVLKFNLAVQQEKPCNIPCLIFNPSDEVKKDIEKIQSAEHTVWLQGRITSYEFEYQGRPIRKVELLTYANSIRTV